MKNEELRIKNEEFAMGTDAYPVGQMRTRRPRFQYQQLSEKWKAQNEK